VPNSLGCHGICLPSSAHIAGSGTLTFRHSGYLAVSGRGVGLWCRVPPGVLWLALDRGREVFTYELELKFKTNSPRALSRIHHNQKERLTPVLIVVLR